MPDIIIDAHGGASGDMILAALIGLGAPIKDITTKIKSLNLNKAFKIESQKKTLKGFHGTQCHVLIQSPNKEWISPEAENKSHTHDHNHCHDHNHSHDHNHYSEIKSLIKNSKFNDKDKKDIINIFEIIAKAEAEVHGQNVDDVAFHEVGAIDSIVDICACVLALNSLKIDQVYCSPITVGYGTVDCAHGTLPLPAPATALILRDIPLKQSSEKTEMCTPTGAAILKYYSQFSHYPKEYKIKQSSIGLSHRIPKKSPPFIRFHLVESLEFDQSFIEEKLQLISTQIDDMTPEYISPLNDKLMKLGALDVSIKHSTMKKGRVAHQIDILCSFDLTETILHHIFSDSTTFGIKLQEINRISLKREFETMTTPWGEIKIKKSKHPLFKKFHAEFEDIKNISSANSISPQEVLQYINKHIEL